MRDESEITQVEKLHLETPSLNKTLNSKSHVEEKTKMTRKSKGKTHLK